MRNNKSPQRQPKKFRLLLDSAFAKPDVFTQLKKKANLAHAVHDMNLSYQAEDEEIYRIADKENRFVLTINFKDFKKLVQKEKPGVIGIDSQLTNDEIDMLIVEFISGKNPQDFIGKAVKI